MCGPRRVDLKQFRSKTGKNVGKTLIRWAQAGRSRVISFFFVFILALCNGELLACPGCLIAGSNKLNDFLHLFKNNEISLGVVTYYYPNLYFYNLFTKSVCGPMLVDLEQDLILFCLSWLCAMESFWRALGVEMLVQIKLNDFLVYFQK